MTYLGELRLHWRPLLAATLGLGVGLQLNAYVVSIIAPHLLQEFGWSKSQFAMIGTIPLVMLIALPLVGRLTDILGVRRIALVGVISMPISFIVISQFQGSLHAFLALYFCQMIVATATSSTVYTRLVAERFVRARGLALAVVASGPAIFGGLGAPLLSGFIDAHDWRVGYLALAVFVGAIGLIALSLMPAHMPAARKTAEPRRRAREDYPMIARSVAFWLLAWGMVLCNLPQALHSSQMKLMLLDNGATSEFASVLISIYAAGVVTGRFACGLALDRLPTHQVAAICMGMPAIGLFLIASTLDSALALGLAVMLIGFSQGAEGDVLAYVVVRYFGIRIYSSVLGLLTAALSAASAGGAMLLSVMLGVTNTFTAFVFFSAIVTVIGSSLLFLLGRVPPAEDPGEREEAPVKHRAAIVEEPA